MPKTDRGNMSFLRKLRDEMENPAEKDPFNM